MGEQKLISNATCWIVHVVFIFQRTSQCLLAIFLKNCFKHVRINSLIPKIMITLTTVQLAQSRQYWNPQLLQNVKPQWSNQTFNRHWRKFCVLHEKTEDVQCPKICFIVFAMHYNNMNEWNAKRMCECVCGGGDIVVGRGVMHTGAGRVITEGELPSSTAVVGPSVDVWVVWWIQGPIAAPRPCWPMHQRGHFSLLTSLTFSPLLLASNHKSPKL